MTIEVTAKKADDAIKQGLEQLGATYDDVKIEVLDTGGLFRKARVRLTLEEPEAEKPEAEQKAAEPAERTPKQAASDKPADESKAQKSEARKAAEPKKQTVKPEAKKSKQPTEKAAEVKNDCAPSEQSECDNPTAPSARNAKSEDVQSRTDKKQREKARHAPSDADIKSECEGETADAPSSEQADASARKAKRRLKAEDREAASHALEFVNETVKLMGFDAASVSADTDMEHIEITAPDGDDSLIIGRHGETLSALTYLAETCARAEKCHVNIVVDCNGYRARRAASLTAMAKRRARESAQKHRRIKLEPMDRTDRRTIHCALADDGYVTTASEGKEPYRYVVISPKDGEAYDYEERRERGKSRDRRGDRGGNDGKGGAPAGEKPRRAAFDINIHGFVGHNDPVPEQPSEQPEQSDAPAEE